MMTCLDIEQMGTLVGSAVLLTLVINGTVSGIVREFAYNLVNGACCGFYSRVNIIWYLYMQVYKALKVYRPSRYHDNIFNMGIDRVRVFVGSRII